MKIRFPLWLICPVLCFARAADATDFKVINTANSGAGSLFQAITDANANPGRDRIVFNIPGPGVHIIDVSNGGLPTVTDPLIIDGYTQPGAQPNTLASGDDAIILIQIDNSQHNLPAGLFLTGGDSIVRGLSITGFNFDTGGGRAVAVKLAPPGTGNIVEGNFLGLTPDGITPGPNGYGVSATAAGTLIGGTNPQARNIISGNDTLVGAGIAIYNSSATVLGNYVGTDASGTVVRANSQQGIYVEDEIGHGVVIGGVAAGAGNLISGNQVGIRLGRTGSFFGQFYTVPANGVTISGNRIGVASDGTTLAASGPATTGIDILAGSGNVIGGLDPSAGNVIAFVHGVGVSIDLSGSINNSILSNSIYGRGVGIQLGPQSPQPNDPMDTDEGPNHRQNFPIIITTFSSGPTTAIFGSLNSSPNTQFTIQLFSDGGDYSQLSQTLLQTTTVLTDNNGDALFSVGVPVDSVTGPINATATDPAGNTSEFFLRPSHLRNLATRARVEPGDGAVIGGFIPQGSSSAASEIIVRVIGPSLSSGGTPLAGRLQDPTLEVYVNGFLIGSNDNWPDDPALVAELQRYGLTPSNPSEAAAIIRPGSDGHYTVVVRGKNGSSGIALVEFYDVSGTNLRPVNMSTRGLVQTGDNAMIGGLILADGSGPTPVVVRAIGPSLASFGVANPLADPTVELYNSNGISIAMNDDWREGQEAELIATGLAPANPAESAIFALLEPGSYTAVVRGKANSTGLALVETYQLP